MLDTYWRNELIRRKHEGRRRKASLTIFYLSFLLQACERELEIEHNCNIFTPLLWPSRCVFLVLLMVGSTPSGFSRAPSVGCGFPYHIWSLAVWNPPDNSLAPRTQLSWIIIQRPHDHPLDLWNRMFNRHQAEITVMQFRGHSLPVHQSLLAQWDLHLVPYYKP